MFEYRGVPMKSKRQPQAVFHVEGSATIGQGHVRRCLTVAHELNDRGWHCIFYSPATASDVTSIVGAAVPVTGSLPEGPVELMVVDSYDTDVSYERSLRDQAGLILAFDDRPIRHHECDVLIDASPGRAGSDYRGLVPESCELLVGPGFAPVSERFVERREASLARRRAVTDPTRVFVSFGASDSGSMTLRTIRALASVTPGIHFDAAVTSVAPRVDELRDTGEQLANVTVHVDSDDIAGLMMEADLAVGAAGTTSLERCCLGLPAIVCVTAENQMDVARGLEAAGAAVVTSAERTEDALVESFRSLLDDPSRTRTMSEAAAALCDGLGAGRVADRIENRLPEGTYAG